jgi:transmembrane carrier protein
MYEYFKHRLSYLLYDKPSSLRPFEASLCGSAAGGIAAALTTPLDVLKTRVMLDLRVRRADFSSEICLPVSGPFSSCLPISSRPTSTDISLGGDPRAVRWCRTENHVDLSWWGRVFGYVRVDYRYLRFFARTLSPRSPFWLPFLSSVPASNHHIGGPAKTVRPARFDRTFLIFFSL